MENINKLNRNSNKKVKKKKKHTVKEYKLVEV